MKGLILKDFYTLFKQAKIFLLIIVIFAFMPGYSISAMAVFYAAMLPITALAYDDRAKWDNLAAMMPYSTQSIILSKYIIGYIGIVAASILSVAAQSVMGIINHSSVESEALLSLLISACLSAVMLSINLPVMFKFGVEKGRIAFFILIGAIVVIGMALGDKLDSSLSSANPSIATVAAVILAVTVIISIISIGVSTVMYKNRRV